MQSNPPQTSLQYRIFAYREELGLRRRNIPSMTRAKCDISEQLIVDYIDQLSYCTEADLDAFNRQLAVAVDQSNIIENMTIQEDQDWNPNYNWIDKEIETILDELDI